MTQLSGMGIGLDLPQGWDGRIAPRDPGTARLPAGAAPPTGGALAHVANFPLPPTRGDFGSGAVEIMSGSDVLMVLLEYGRESASTALFATPGPPRQLAPDAFSSRALQRTIQGQAGLQMFFTASGRPFCLYVVLGSYNDRSRLVPMVNTVLLNLVIT